MKAFGYVLGLGLAALVAGCGGGGGSSGNTQLEYKISLTTERSQMPVNVGHVAPGIGATARYTTPLTVMATEGGNPILGGANIFGCRLQGVGYLAYLDGNHTDADGSEKLYESITLGANSGGSSFYFHAGDRVGTAQITCSVTDPRDQQVKSASVNISVGNGSAPAAGLPASLRAAPRDDDYSGYLGAYNTPKLSNTVALQAFVSDEVGQPVGATSTPNLQVYIQASDASEGARLMEGRQSGTVITTNTVNGVATFTLQSGVQRGVITLVMVADRADNNVANGIQDPIVQRMIVPVVNGIAQTALAVADQSVTATCRQAVSTALVASGGVPPYVWSLANANVSMPAGLTLGSDGLVSGVPVLANGVGAGTYQVALRVTDDNLTSVGGTLTVTVDPGDCKPLSIADSSVAITRNTAFAFALSASGGTPAYKWKIVAGAPTGIQLTDQGILQGLVTTAGTYQMVVEVTDSDGLVVRGNLTVQVSDPAK